MNTDSLQEFPLNRYNRFCWPPGAREATARRHPRGRDGEGMERAKEAKSEGKCILISSLQSWKVEGASC